MYQKGLKMDQEGLNNVPFQRKRLFLCPKSSISSQIGHGACEKAQSLPLPLPVILKLGPELSEHEQSLFFEFSLSLILAPQLSLD